jgi:hypothetical protein
VRGVVRAYGPDDASGPACVACSRTVALLGNAPPFLATIRSALKHPFEDRVMRPKVDSGLPGRAVSRNDLETAKDCSCTCASGTRMTEGGWTFDVNARVRGARTIAAASRRESFGHDPHWRNHRADQ